MWCTYVYLVKSYACSEEVAFGADMLLVVIVEPLLAFISGPYTILNANKGSTITELQDWSYSKCCSI